ncbi:MAG TPA: sensor histidine kinase [Ktedonosporobacter sp.]|nr:sensor histidine kinase [Ktedonosporobacter sp.]
MSKLVQKYAPRLQRWHLSLFEKVILVNSGMLIIEALAGLWVTSHNLEAHHYLIDTSFLVMATVCTLLINTLLLRASFRPLFNLLTTIRAVSAGKTEARASIAATSEVGELARAFNSMLDRLEEARNEQTRLILQAQEKEQRRIALELHDEAGQNLTALLVHTEVLHQRIQTMEGSAPATETQQQLKDGLQQLTRLTQQTLESIRVLAQQLRPSVLDDLGLLAAFRWLVEDSRQRLQLQVDLAIEGMEECAHQLPAEYETTLFRIAQESLTNITRHAQTRRASILLRQDQQQIFLRINDAGCGYDTLHHHPGSGSVGMRERAMLLKGTLTIRSQTGQGTTVEAILPRPIQ